MADGRPATPANEADENNFCFAGDRGRGGKASDPAANHPSSAKIRSELDDEQRRWSVDAGDLPEGMGLRYLIERRRLTGEQRYYENASDAKPAFRDKGSSLVADNNSRDLIRDMLEIADHRGWDRVRVSGTDAFRREVWRQATLRGIEVDGFRPTARERQEVERMREQRSARATVVASGTDKTGQPHRERAAGNGGAGGEQRRAPEHVDFNKGMAGRLDHVGEAHYGGMSSGKLTPFADIILDDGHRERAWGVYLPVALRSSGADVGDRVVLRRLGTERVRVKVAVVDPHTGEHRSDVQGVNRNRWSVQHVLSPEMKTPKEATELSGITTCMQKGRELCRATDHGAGANRTPDRSPPGTDGHDVELAFRPNGHIRETGTEPTSKTVERSVRTSVSPGQAKEQTQGRGIPKKPDAAHGNNRHPINISGLHGDIDTSDQLSEPARLVEGTPFNSRARDTAKPIRRGEGGIRDPETATGRSGADQIDRLSDRKSQMELANRFRHVSSAEAARDPELQAAQSQFIAAKAFVTATLGHEPLAAQRLIARSRETIARALEQGRTIPVAEMIEVRAKATFRDRKQPERTRHSPPADGTTATTAPARSRTR